LNVAQKGIVDFFSGAERGPQRENKGDSTESQKSRECAQPRSYAGSDQSSRAAPAVENYRQKPRCQHAQPGRFADDDDDNRHQQRDSGGGQSLSPFERRRLRWRVGCVVLDGGLWAGYNGRERFGCEDPNLGGTAGGAERGSLLDVCATSITRMFH
jgi:hypothetical protein